MLSVFRKRLGPQWTRKSSPLFEQDHLEVVETLLACAEPRGGLVGREPAGQGLLDYGSDVGIVLPFM